MRIDSSPYSSLSIEIGQSVRPKATSTVKAESSNTVADDSAVLSTSEEAVRSLESEIKNLPEVRQERVATLRSSIQKNQYSISPEKIAEGIYREIASLPCVSQHE